MDQSGVADHKIKSADKQALNIVDVNSPRDKRRDQIIEIGLWSIQILLSELHMGEWRTQYFQKSNKVRHLIPRLQ